MKKFVSIFLILVFILSIGNAQALSVNSYEELKNAIANLEPEIDIESDLSFNELLIISGDIIINGNNHTITREDTYSEGLFSILSSGNLEINNLKIDGGAPNWEMDTENASADSSGYYRADVINGDDDILANQAVITNLGDLTINSSVLQNIRNSNTSTDKSGGAIRHSGCNLNINDSKFIRAGTYHEGGALYINKGTVVIKDSLFDSNAAGVDYKARAHGGAIYVNGANSVDIDNTTFNNNFAQHNGGAVMIQTNACDLKISNSTFSKNSCGNDGSTISLDSTKTKHSLLIEDCIFDSNVGLAINSQSMGTLWLDSWKNDSTIPAVFKNLVFKNNHTATGSTFASYGTLQPYCVMDNIESYNNITESVGGYFIQEGTYLISNANIHDNKARSGAAVASVGGNVIISDSIIKNNTASQRGGGPIAIFGSMTIKDSEITNNHSNGYGGGIAAYSMYASYGSPELHLENVLVKDNTADISGGGLSIQDTGNAHSIITVDNLSKIYDNSAKVAGDDVLYSHANNSSGANTTLDNIGIAGLLGIDGWYFDAEGDRFKDTDNPTVFDDYVNNDGSVSFYIKAAGVSTASYDGNGASTDALPVTVKYGETYVVDDDIPVKEGYTFKEWNTKSDGTGTSLKAGDTYDGSEGFVLYAILEPNQYTITFDTKGGTEISPIKQAYNTEVEAPNDPTKEGYSFKGWDKEIPEKMPAEDMTITASWEANEYTITFDTKGGSEIAPIKQAYDTDVAVPNNPTKEGYTFKGWDKEIPTKMPAENMTITASWEANESTITFDTKGGTEISPIKQAYNTDVVAPNSPTKKGYTFKGWDKEIPTKMPAEDMTITANWEANEYTITFDTKGGNEIAPIKQAYDTNVEAPKDPTKEGYIFKGWDKEIPAKMPAEDLLITAKWEVKQYTITFDTKGGTKISTINQKYNTEVEAPKDPTKEGYTFKGWDKEIPTKMPAEDLVITAKWEINKYTITYDTDGGTKIEPQTLEYGEEVDKPKNPTKSGYNFIDWDKEIPEKMPAENLTITANWRKKNSTSSYSGGGSSKKTKKDDESKKTTETATPTKIEEPVIIKEEEKTIVPAKESGETKVDNNITNEIQPTDSGDKVVLVNTSGEQVSEPELVKEEQVNNETTTTKESSSKDNVPSANTEEKKSLRADSYVDGVSEKSDKEQEIAPVMLDDTKEITQDNDKVEVPTIDNKNPQTDDNIIFNLIMLALSLLGVIVGIIYYKRKYLAKNK